MEKVNKIYKNSGNGRIAAIVSVTSGNSVTRNTTKTSSEIVYKKFLEEYIGYDKVYIVVSSQEPKKVNPDICAIDDALFGIETVNLFIDKHINDIFSVQHALIFFGGYMPTYYFSTCNRISEWYINNKNENNDNTFYLIHDDPDYATINPALYCDKRIEGTKLRNSAKSYKYDSKHPDVELYIKYNDTLHECFTNLTVAYCGTYYPEYFERAPKYGFGTPNVLTEPKYWDNFFAHYYAGVNMYIDEKLKDYPFCRKIYQSTYYGYVKHDAERIKITEDMYNALDNTVLIYKGKKPFSNNFKNVSEHNAFEYPKLWDTICDNAKATLLICNGSVYNSFIMQRFFDLMIGDIIPFIYLPMDKNKSYVIGDELKDFMYVSTPEEFHDKVEMITVNEQLYKHILELQRKSIYYMFKEYMTESTKKLFENKLFNE